MFIVASTMRPGTGGLGSELAHYHRQGRAVLVQGATIQRNYGKWI